MKRKIKVDMDELDTALNWSMSEWNHYLDLETGKVIGIDDETRQMLEELSKEMYDEQDHQIMSLEKLLQQRDDIRDWQKELLMEADRVDREFGHRYISVGRTIRTRATTTWTISSPRWTAKTCKTGCGVPSVVGVRFGASRTLLPVIRM